MKIGINLLGVLPTIGGAYNYVKSLCEALCEFDNSNEYYFFVTKNSKSIVSRYHKINLIEVNIDSNYRALRIFYENTVLPYLIIKNKLNIVIHPLDTIPFINFSKVIVVSHDFLALINPKTYSFFKRIYLKVSIKFTISNADHICPISETTLKELYRVKNDSINNYTVLPNIISYSFRKAKESEINGFLEKFSIERGFYLYVAHYYPHKNHTRLLKAYAEVLKRKISNNLLVLRGDKLKENQSIQELISSLGIEKKVIFLPRIEEKEIHVLYSAASALIFPSLYEGGGIPVMEAMACECPIIASDIPTTIEFAADAAILFDGKDVESIIAAIQQFHKERQTHRLKFGLAKINNQRPDKIVNDLLSGIKQLL